MALGLGPSYREFESLHHDHFKLLDSSMVEHLAVNEDVVGSSPTPGATFCGYNIVANVLVFQTREEGSIPSTRSIFAGLAQLARATDL